MQFVIKITDFRLSEDVFERNYFRQNLGRGEGVKLSDNLQPLQEPITNLKSCYDDKSARNIKWMAPESLSDGLFSEKSDVVCEPPVD